MAEELETELLFVLAEEGTGRSKRLADCQALCAELASVAPRAEAYECLDQLGTAELMQGRQRRAAQASAELRGAIAAHRDGRRIELMRHLRRALRLDPGGAIERDLGLGSAEDPLFSDN